VSRVDVAGAHTSELAPVSQRGGGQLWAVIAADEPRCGAAFDHQAVQDRHRVVGVDAAVDLDGEGFTGVFVDDVILSSFNRRPSWV
jgi:hypothetical protein